MQSNIFIMVLLVSLLCEKAIIGVLCNESFFLKASEFLNLQETVLGVRLR